MLRNFKKKFIGTKDFYIYVLGIAVPMIVQNAITSFVSFLDNIMVGRIGTEQMSGVAIVNQLIFVFNISLYPFNILIKLVVLRSLSVKHTFSL